jgi:hypothetical protein
MRGKKPISIMSSKLYSGDAMDPGSTDIIIQEGLLDVGQPVPEGWTVMTGNNTHSVVMRIAYRYQIEEADEANAAG